MVAKARCCGTMVRGTGDSFGLAEKENAWWWLWRAMTGRSEGRRLFVFVLGQAKLVGKPALGLGTRILYCKVLYY